LDILTSRTSGAVMPLFDSAYYLRMYPDVAAAGIDPYLHYIQHGAGEGRKPHALFDTSYYVENHKELAASDVNPLLHYCESGARQGWDPHPLFDTAYYVGQTKLAGTGKNPFSTTVRLVSEPA
jgi:hypothetical protein